MTHLHISITCAYLAFQQSFISSSTTESHDKRRPLTHFNQQGTLCCLIRVCLTLTLRARYRQWRMKIAKCVFYKKEQEKKKKRNGVEKNPNVRCVVLHCLKQIIYKEILQDRHLARPCCYELHFPNQLRPQGGFVCCVAWGSVCVGFGIENSHVIYACHIMCVWNGWPVGCNYRVLSSKQSHCG